MPIQPLRLVVILAALLFGGAAAADLVKIVVLGDSLTAGMGLARLDAFPVRLEAELRARGYDVTIVDAGVSGDTATAGLARVDWSIPDDTQAVIVELGANDALRGVDPKITREAIDAILGKLVERRLPVLLTGMMAPRNLGADYALSFNAIFPDLAEKHGVKLYPFFLDGVATDAELNQADGMHPNPAGVDVIVQRILPSVEGLLTEVNTPP